MILPTGLPNRFFFYEKLKAAARVSCDLGLQLGLLFVDLDGFKNVNDTLGHARGDEVLREVTTRVTSVIGASDFAARLGGDEFAILHSSGGCAIHWGPARGRSRCRH